MDEEASKELEELKAWIIAEAKREAEENDVVRSRCELVSFVSYSKGRGRKRKFPKDVKLLKYNGRCYTLHDNPRNGLDVIAKEILEGLVAHGEDEYKALLELLESSRPG